MNGSNNGANHVIVLAISGLCGLLIVAIAIIQALQAKETPALSSSLAALIGALLALAQPLKRNGP